MPTTAHAEHLTMSADPTSKTSLLPCVTCDGQDRVQTCESHKPSLLVRYIRSVMRALWPTNCCISRSGFCFAITLGHPPWRRQ